MSNDPFELSYPPSLYPDEERTRQQAKIHVEMYLFADRFSIVRLGAQARFYAERIFGVLLVKQWRAGEILETVLSGTHQTDAMRGGVCRAVAENAVHAQKDNGLIAALEKYEPMAWVMFHQTHSK
jgi:hypothetical protein